jgi:hypothetical protein
VQLFVGIRIGIDMLPLMGLSKAMDQLFYASKLVSRRIGIADQGKILIENAMVGGTGKTSGRVVDDSDVGGMECGHADVHANIAAGFPFAMWLAVSETGVKDKGGTPGGGEELASPVYEQRLAVVD